MQEKGELIVYGGNYFGGNYFGGNYFDGN